MKRIYIFLFTALLVCTGIKAQWSVGLMAGYDYNFYSYEKEFAYDYRYGDKEGFELTIPVQYNFCDWLGVRADLSYVQKGHTMHRTGVYKGQYTDTRDHYMHLPLMLSFSFGGRKVRGWFNPGGYIGYWMASYWEGVTQMVNGPNGEYYISQDETMAYHFSEKVKFMDQRDNRLDAGLTGVIGVGWRFMPQLELRVEGVCWYSLVNRESGSSGNIAPRYDSTLAARIGLAYSFGKGNR